MLISRIIICCLALLIANTIDAQPDPSRWTDEIGTIKDKIRSTEKDIKIVFTGSSSIRMWSDLSDRYDREDIINTGFGGSQMFELEYWLDDLVLAYDPEKVFIYEGDNDVSAGKSNEAILKSAAGIVERLRQKNSDMEIYFIAAKPSISRWALKEKYLSFNEALKNFCETYEHMYFVDVWTPMLDADGNPISNIFIEDNLHMNSAGYDIWEKVIRPYLE